MAINQSNLLIYFCFHSSILLYLSQRYKIFFIIKDGYLRSEAEGFIEGSVLQEFLNFDEKYRIDFMKNLKYPFQKSLNETINLIETFLKYH